MTESGPPGEDLRRRRAALAAAEAELAGEVAPARRATLEATRREQRDQLEHARVGDPDLASLRGLSEFAQLFE